MKVGIIVYSQTGNTLSVAQKLEEALVRAGHFVQLEQVTEAHKSQKTSKSVQLEHQPDISHYEVLFFGAPVHAFSLAAPMSAYLSGLSSLNGKKVGGFVTQQMKHAWMGGNRAVGQIKKICREKGAEVFTTGVVGWSSELRGKQIEAVVERFCRLS